MNDIALWNATTDWTEVLINVLLFVVPVALTAAGIFLSGTVFWKSLQSLVRALRSSFDEAADPAVVWIAQLTKLPAETVAKIAVALFDAILTNPEARAALEAGGWTLPATTRVNIADQLPVREVNLGEAAVVPAQGLALKWMDGLSEDAQNKLAAILETDGMPPTPAGPPPQEDCADEPPE